MLVGEKLPFSIIFKGKKKLSRLIDVFPTYSNISGTPDYPLKSRILAICLNFRDFRIISFFFLWQRGTQGMFTMFQEIKIEIVPSSNYVYLV